MLSLFICLLQLGSVPPGVRVYEDYDGMLNQTNIGQNNNKFYVLQLLVPPAEGATTCYFWTRWVRSDGKGALFFSGILFYYIYFPTPDTKITLALSFPHFNVTANSFQFIFQGRVGERGHSSARLLLSLNTGRTDFERQFLEKVWEQHLFCV